MVSVDLRGNGESDKPVTAAASGIDRHVRDLLAVADRAGASTFALWAFLYGANIGRYLASRSDRVKAMVYIGIPFGPAADPVFRQGIADLHAKWKPVVEAARAGTLDLAALPERDRATWQRTNVPVTMAWTTALLDDPPVEPVDMRCPTLWVVGTANPAAMDRAGAYRDRLAGTRVSLTFLDGLTHPQELDLIDRAFPEEAAFTRRYR